ASRALKILFMATGRTTLRFTARCQDPTKLSRSKPSEKRSLIGLSFSQRSQKHMGILELETSEHLTALIAEHPVPVSYLIRESLRHSVEITHDRGGVSLCSECHRISPRARYYFDDTVLVNRFKKFSIDSFFFIVHGKFGRAIECE
ncbi:hypothetical protein EBZ37_12705, partial [bacterium]|nr:hypothetical protein [bacterium]